LLRLQPYYLEKIQRKDFEYIATLVALEKSLRSKVGPCMRNCTVYTVIKNGDVISILVHL